jgi:hypothetical protein
MIETVRVPRPANAQIVLVSVVRSTCCPLGRARFPSLQNRVALSGTSGCKGRPYAWYFQHFEPVDKEKYPDDAIDLLGKKGRLFQDNALMACKMCKVQDARFTCRHNPSTTLGNHLLMACEGFQESPHWQHPEVVQKLGKYGIEGDISLLAARKLCVSWPI